MTDVTIPADVAKRMADWMRHNAVSYNSRAGLHEWADLLDPKPPTLRERVADAFLTLGRRPEPTTAEEAADAVLTVVRDAVAAMKGAPGIGFDTVDHYRDAVLDLLDGGTR